MIIAKVKGLDNVLRNLKKAGGNFEKKIETGLKRAGLYVQRESQKICPVDQGNLHGSAFTRPEGSGAKTKVTVGYTAEYAIFVHENLDAAHGTEYNQKHAEAIADKSNKRMRSRGENQTAKFLERIVREKRKEIFEKVAGK